MSSEQILKDDLARASRVKTQEQRKSENQIVAKELEQHKSKTTSEPTHANEIKLKGTCLLALKLI